MLSSNRTSASVWQESDEHPFGEPCRRLPAVEARRLQCCRPVFTKIDAHRAMLSGGDSAEFGQRGGLELDHLRLIDLVHRRARRPGKPVGAGIQPGRHDHDLANARLAGVGEELVVKHSAGGERVGHPREPDTAVDVGEIRLTGGHPGKQVQPDRANQRLGERVVDHRVGAPARRRPGRRHHRCGRSHASG